MWFRLHRRKTGGTTVSLRPTAAIATTPRKAAAKSSKKSIKRFHWPNLRRSLPLPATHRNVGASPRLRAALPPTPMSNCEAVPRRIRCGTTVIPIMRASALQLPPLPSTPVGGLKRRPTTASSSLEEHLQKIRRLSRRSRSNREMEHFNPVYDDIYSVATSEDEAIYEEIGSSRKRTLIIPVENLDLMQVSAMIVDDSSLKRMKPSSTGSNQGIYALHGGDWISVASGIYDDVASSGSESDEEFDPDAGIYGWSAASIGAANIPWTTAALGRSTDFMGPQWTMSQRRESYVMN